MSQDALKAQAAEAACSEIEDGMVVGVGSGSTVHFFIDQLVSIKHRIEACVASSQETEKRLKKAGISVIDLNVAGELALYVDGADEVTHHGDMIKGGGGALTREKILASAARRFVAIVDESKLVQRLGAFPVAVEVIPMARSLAARQLVQLGGDPVYRMGFTTDNGNIILDVHHLKILTPIALEESIKNITGVVECGLFAKRIADKVLVATSSGVSVLEPINKYK